MNFLDIVKDIIKEHELNKPNRKRHIMYKKIYLQAKLRESGFTFNDIGNMFNQNHSSVVHNVKSHKILTDLYSKEYMHEIYKLVEQLDGKTIEIPKRNIYHDILNERNKHGLRRLKRWIKEKRYDFDATIME